jgi:hypothetical protein
VIRVGPNPTCMVCGVCGPFNSKIPERIGIIAFFLLVFIVERKSSHSDAGVNVQAATSPIRSPKLPEQHHVILLAQHPSAS